MSGASMAVASAERDVPGRAARPTWALIDAREPGNAARVGGIPLLCRQVRLAAAAGWSGACVWSSSPADAQRVLALAPPPAGFTVEVSTDPPRDETRSWLRVDARAVYSKSSLADAGVKGADPKPEILVRSPADARDAQAMLFRNLRKSVDADGVVAYYVMRPISRLITRALVNTPVTPNQVTLVAMLCGVAAAVVAGFGGRSDLLLAGFLLWAGAAIDCVDGELARLRLQGSKMGEWLDTLSDDIASFGSLLGVCIGLRRAGYHPAWLWAGATGAVVGFATQVKLYVDLHRMGMPIDTSQYPWFLGKPSGGMIRDRGVIGWIVYACAFFFRRDAFVTMLVVFFALDWRRFAVGMMLFGIVFLLVLLALHEIVGAVRRRRA